MNLVDKFIHRFVHLNIEFGLLICPFWPSQPFFPIFTQYLDWWAFYIFSLNSRKLFAPQGRIPFSGMQHFFSLCSDQGISKETCACLLRSIDTQSLCAYLRTWKNFANWCYTRQIDYSSLSLNVVSDYLIYLFKKGHQVSFLNVARSSLSFFLSQLFEIGEHPRIKRVFRFFGRRRSSFPRYFVILGY